MSSTTRVNMCAPFVVEVERNRRWRDDGNELRVGQTYLTPHRIGRSIARIWCSFVRCGMSSLPKTSLKYTSGVPSALGRAGAMLKRNDWLLRGSRDDRLAAILALA